MKRNAIVAGTVLSLACALALTSCKKDEIKAGETPTVKLEVVEEGVSTVSFRITATNAAEVAYIDQDDLTSVPSARAILTAGKRASVSEPQVIEKTDCVPGETYYYVAAAVSESGVYSEVATIELTAAGTNSTFNIEINASTDDAITYTVSPSDDNVSYITSILPAETYSESTDDEIFEAIVNQVFRGNPLVEKAPYFIDHAGIETCPEAGGNAFAAQFPVDVYTDNIAVERRVLTAFGWKSFVVFGNLDGSNGPFCRVYVGLVMQDLVSFEYGFEFRERFICERFAQRLVLWDHGHAVSFEHGFDIKSRATAQERYFMPVANIVVGRIEIALVFVEVVFISRFTNVYEMIGYLVSVYRILFQVFSRPDIHSPIYLPGVGTDDFCL